MFVRYLKLNNNAFFKNWDFGLKLKKFGERDDF